MEQTVCSSSEAERGRRQMAWTSSAQSVPRVVAGGLGIGREEETGHAGSSVLPTSTPIGSGGGESGDGEAGI